MTPEGIEFGEMTDRELLAAIYQQVRATNGTVKDHERRLRWVERFQWMLTGMWMLLVAAGGWVAKTIPWGFLGKNR